MKNEAGPRNRASSRKNTTPRRRSRSPTKKQPAVSSAKQVVQKTGLMREPLITAQHFDPNSPNKGGRKNNNEANKRPRKKWTKRSALTDDCIVEQTGKFFLSSYALCWKSKFERAPILIS